jgi:hypothetical protein
MSAKTAVATEEQTRRGGSKKKYTGLIILTAAVVAASVAVIVLYTSGKARYEGKFLPDTFINGVDVGGLTVEQACEKLESEELADTLTVQTIDNEVTFSTADFDYASNTRQEIENMYKQVNHTKWYEYHWNQTDFTYTEAVSYDKDKLKSLIKSADWGSTESSDATVEYDEEKGYSVVPEVVGDKITDMDLLTDTIVDSVDSGKFTLTVGEDSGCYTLPTVVSDDLSDRVEKLNKVFNMSITYDFDYTTETLSGSELLDMLDIDEEDGSYTVDSDKAMAYVEKLAEKYDTYDTPRKFKATLQGDITVPRSDDAKYGWWIWQDETCDALVKMLLRLHRR